jgi:hypothetical protein
LERLGNFGTYVDPNLSTRGFLARDYSHDAFELGWATGPSTFNAMLATNDSKFNTGYIRFEENLKLGKTFEIGAAYRVNAIDVITNTAVLTHRAAAKASFTVMPSLRVYGEAGMIVTGENEDLATAENALKPEYGEIPSISRSLSGWKFLLQDFSTMPLLKWNISVTERTLRKVLTM